MDDLFSLFFDMPPGVKKVEGCFFLRATSAFQQAPRTMLFGCSLEGPELVESGVDEMWVCAVQFGLIERYRDTRKRFGGYRADQVLTDAYYEPNEYGATGGGMIEEMGMQYPLFGNPFHARLFLRTGPEREQQTDPSKRGAIIAGTLIGDPGMVDRAIDEMWFTSLQITPTRRFRDTKRAFAGRTIAEALTDGFAEERLYGQEVDLNRVPKSP